MPPAPPMSSPVGQVSLPWDSQSHSAWNRPSLALLWSLPRLSQTSRVLTGSHALLHRRPPGEGHSKVKPSLCGSHFPRTDTRHAAGSRKALPQPLSVGLWMGQCPGTSGVSRARQLWHLELEASGCCQPLRCQLEKRRHRKILLVHRLARFSKQKNKSLNLNFRYKASILKS